MDPLRLAILQAFERYVYLLIIEDAIKAVLYYYCDLVVCPIHGLERIR